MSPLPSVRLFGAKQCKARSKRSLARCKNPAAFGMPVCRFHGARRSEAVLRGQAHPNFKHGDRTKEPMRRHSEFSIRLRELEDLMHQFGMTTAPRTRGRKAVTSK